MDQKTLKTLLRYEPETGEFYWLIRRGGTRIGARAGATKNNGYRHIRYAGGTYLSHRLAWLYVHGRLPAGDIDHIDGDPSNNRIENLRIATQTQNNANYKKVRAISGFKGVRSHHGKWRADIMCNYKYVYIGVYPSPEAAAEAYKQAAVRLFGEFASDQ